MNLLPSFLLTYRPSVVELDARAGYCTCELPSGAVHTFLVRKPERLREFCQRSGIKLREITPANSFAIGEAMAGGGGRK